MTAYLADEKAAKKIAKLEKELADKAKILSDYSAVVNAMPGYMKVAVANAAVAAHQGADAASLAAMVSEEGLEKVKAKLAAPTVFLMTAGDGFKDPAKGWPLTKSSACSVCGGAIPVGAIYASVWPAHFGGPHIFAHEGECLDAVAP